MQPLNTTAANQPMATTLQVHDPYNYENCYTGDPEPPHEGGEADHRHRPLEFGLGHANDAQIPCGSYPTPTTVPAVVAPSTSQMGTSPSYYHYNPPPMPFVTATATFPTQAFPRGPFPSLPLHQPSSQPQPYPYPVQCQQQTGWWNSAMTQYYYNDYCCCCCHAAAAAFSPTNGMYCVDFGQPPEVQQQPYEVTVRPPPPLCIPNAKLARTNDNNANYCYKYPQNRIVDPPLPLPPAPVDVVSATPDCYCVTTVAPSAVATAKVLVVAENFGFKVPTMKGVHAYSTEEQVQAKEAFPTHLQMTERNLAIPTAAMVALSVGRSATGTGFHSGGEDQTTTTIPPVPATPPPRKRGHLPSSLPSCQSTPGPITPSPKVMSTTRQGFAAQPQPWATSPLRADAVCLQQQQQQHDGHRVHWDDEREPLAQVIDTEANTTDTTAAVAAPVGSENNRLSVLSAYLHGCDNKQCSFSQISDPGTSKMTIFPDEPNLKLGDFKRWIDHCGQAVVGVGVDYTPDGEKDYRLWLREAYPYPPYPPSYPRSRLRSNKKGWHPRTMSDLRK